VWRATANFILGYFYAFFVSRNELSYCVGETSYPFVRMVYFRNLLTDCDAVL